MSDLVAGAVSGQPQVAREYFVYDVLGQVPFDSMEAIADEFRRRFLFQRGCTFEFRRVVEEPMKWTFTVANEVYLRDE